MDKYFLYEKSKHFEKIIGLFSYSISTWSIFILSINDDEYVLFSYINQDSGISSENNKKIVLILKLINILNF